MRSALVLLLAVAVAAPARADEPTLLDNKPEELPTAEHPMFSALDDSGGGPAPGPVPLAEAAGAGTVIGLLQFGWSITTGMAVAGLTVGLTPPTLDRLGTMRGVQVGLGYTPSVLILLPVCADPAWQSSIWRPIAYLLVSAALAVGSYYVRDWWAAPAIGEGRVGPVYSATAIGAVADGVGSALLWTFLLWGS